MIIRKPTGEDIPGLQEIWKEAFGDTQEAVSAFYETAFSRSCCLVAAGEQVMGGIYWLDARIEGRKVAYLYALAVAKPCRGQGIGKRLLETACRSLEDRGFAAALLIPAQQSLYGYYEKLGFASFGRMQQETVTAHGPEAEITRVTAEEYAQRRQALMPRFVWEMPMLSYLERVCPLYAGQDYVLAVGDGTVQEYIGPRELLPRLLYTLNIDAAQAHLSGGQDPAGMANCFEKISLPDWLGPAMD